MADHYVRLWSGLHRGSMLVCPAALALWPHILLAADAQGNVDASPSYFQKLIGLPQTMIDEAIAYLEAPDPDSQTPDEEGRRLVRLEGRRGWRIVTWAQYRARAVSANRREYMREYMRDVRAEEARQNGAGEPESVKELDDRPKESTESALTPLADSVSLPLIEVEGRKKKVAGRKKNKPPESPEFAAAWALYPRRANSSRDAARRAWAARIAAGETPETLTAGVRAYAAFVAANGTEEQYIKHAATFFGPDRHYLNDFARPTGSANGRHAKESAQDRAVRHSQEFLRLNGIDP